MKGASVDQTDRFTEAYHDSYSAMFTAVYAKVGNADESEEICQELFLRLYRRMGEVENPRSWLYGALRLVLLEHYRKKGRSEEDIDALIDEVPAASSGNSDDARMLIREAVEDKGTFLNDLDRSLFELVAVYDYSFAEAARHLGISYRQARYGFDCVAKRIVSYFRSKGITNLEDML